MTDHQHAAGPGPARPYRCTCGAQLPLGDVVDHLEREHGQQVEPADGRRWNTLLNALGVPVRRRPPLDEAELAELRRQVGAEPDV